MDSIWDITEAVLAASIAALDDELARDELEWNRLCGYTAQPSEG